MRRKYIWFSEKLSVFTELNSNRVEIIIMKPAKPGNIIGPGSQMINEMFISQYISHKI